MPKYSKSFSRVRNPYDLLALNIFLEAFRNIESYYTGEGSTEERIAGKEDVKWIKKMTDNFNILAVSVGPEHSIEWFHQLAIRKINEIKRAAYNDKKTMGRKDK
jgi:hypothetical protein